MAPELSTIWSASATKISPPLSTSTPTAFLPSKMIRRVVALGRMVRFRRCRAGFR